MYIFVIKGCFLRCNQDILKTVKARLIKYLPIHFFQNFLIEGLSLLRCNQDILKKANARLIKYLSIHFSGL